MTFLLFVFSIACVSASDNITQTGNFTELNNKIDISNDSFVLDKDYSDYNTTINISKSITIDGENHSISFNDNSSFKITENNLSLTFKNITFKNNFSITFDNETNIASFNLTLIDCYLQPYYISAIEVHNYGYDWGYGYSCPVTDEIKELAFEIIGKSEGLKAAKKLTLCVCKNIENEANAGFFQTPRDTLKRRAGNCCCQAELLLQMMDAVGLCENHELYFIHVGSNVYGNRHFFAMIDNLCVDPTLKNPWGHGGFHNRSAVITPYPVLPLPYGDYR